MIKQLTEDEEQKIIEKRENRTLNEVTETLSEYQKKGINLSPEEIDFIYARRDYLDSRQKELWSDLLKEKASQVRKAAKEKEEGEGNKKPGKKAPEDGQGEGTPGEQDKK